MKNKILIGILLVSLVLMSAGCENIIGIPFDKMYDDFKDFIYGVNWNTIINEDKVLSPNQISDYPPLNYYGVSGNVNLRYEIIGSEKFDVILFVNQTSLDLYKQGLNTTHYPSCDSFNIKTINKEDCKNINSNFIFVIVNGDKDNELKVKIEYSPVTS